MSQIGAFLVVYIFILFSVCFDLRSLVGVFVNKSVLKKFFFKLFLKVLIYNKTRVEN